MMKEMKRIISMVLCLVMVLSLLPVGAVRVHAEETEPKVVDAALFFSDLHTSENNYKDAEIKAILGGVKKSGRTFSTVTSVGDAFSSNRTAYTGDVSKITKSFQEGLGYSTFEMLYAWSDHDRKAGIENFTGLLYGNENTNYYIYTISMSDMSTEERYGQKSTFTDEKLTDFTTTVESLDHSKPLFIVSHMPLHDQRDDNELAYKWYDVISKAAGTMDIAFFWGHNHTQEPASDRAAYYIAKDGSETMKVMGMAEKVTPNFTYLNAGYMSPASTGYTYDSTRQEVVTVVTIYDNAINYTLYDKDGVYDGDYSMNETVVREFAKDEPEATEPPVEQDPTLESIAITKLPTKLTYKVDETVELDGMEVTATYSDGEKRVVTGWTTDENQLDMTKTGTKTITVWYTEGELTKTATFDITVEEEKQSEPPVTPSEPTPDVPAEKNTVTDKNGTGIVIAAPGLSEVAAVVNTDSETVRAAVEQLLTNYVSYDITVEGYTDGNAAEVTLPIPKGVQNPAVYYVAPDGKTQNMRAVNNGNGTVTFTTTHFSTYTVGDTAIELNSQDAVVESTLETTKTPTPVTVYKLVSVPESGKQYLIVNTNMDRQTTTGYGLDGDPSGYAVSKLTSTAGYYKDEAGTVAPDSGTYIAANNNAYLWTAEKVYTGWKFSHNGNYLGNSSNTLSFDKESTWTLSNNVLKSGRNLRFDRGNWSLNRNNSTLVYFYEHVTIYQIAETITGEPGHTYSVDVSNYENAPALNGATVTLTSKLWDTLSTGGNPTEVTSGWDVSYEVVSGKSDAGVVTIDGNVATLSGTAGVAVIKATYTKGEQTAWAEFAVQAKVPSFTVEIEQPESDVVKTDAILDLNAIAKMNGADTNKGSITWAIPEEQQAYATIDENGVVHPVAPGEVTVTVTYTDPKGETHTDTITLKIEEPVYEVAILEPDSAQVTINKTLDLNAIATKDDVEIENAEITWSIPEEQQAFATINENGVITAKAEGDVTVTATWTVGETAYTDTIDIFVVDAIWALELHQPIHTIAKEFKAGTTYYTKDEETGVYTERKNLTKFEEGVTYYTRTVTPVNGTIVIKNVTANQTFLDLWAVIFKDGEDIGQLDPETQLPNLSFESSNEQIAMVNQQTGVLTFTGNKGTVTITAKYYYAEDKYVDDSVTFSLSPSATYQPEDGTDDFPEYPNEGAIRFDKTATAVGTFSQTGITQMELSMTGVPYSKCVDVIVMLDLSSSMNRCIAHDSKSCTVRDCKTRLEELKDAMGTLQSELQGSDNAENIRIAVADFNGMYTSSTSPYYADDDDETDDNAGLNNTEKDKVHTGDGTLTANAFIPVKNLDVSKFTYNASTGTNYDYAFDAIYQLGHAIKKANGDDQRDLYVIFMSDGAPNQYNFYRSIGGDTATSGSAKWNYWLTGTADQYNTNRTWQQNLEELMKCNTHLYYYHEETGNQHRMANAVKGDPNVRYEVIRKATTGLSDVLEATDEANMYTLPGLGATMYSVAFDIANDGRITADSVKHVLQNIPTGGPNNLDYYLEADEEGALETAFGKIAGQIVEAAKDVKVTDKMGDKFTMVFDAPNATVEKALKGTEFEGQDFYIEVRDYKLKPVMEGEEIVDYVRDGYTSKIKLYLGVNDDKTYYAATAGNSKNGANKFATPIFNTTPIGTKLYWTTDSTKGDTAIAVKAGEVTYYFDATGKGTHNMASGAYAYGTITKENIIKDEDKSVMGTNSTSTDLIIATPYFVYNAATKKMVWTAAKLDKTELAITYFLYLDKSGGYSGAVGETKSDTYKTNEYATMLYSNYKGHECEVEFPKPQITWNGAQVTYVFYLVNKDGRPVNRAGTVVPFSEAVYVTDPATYHVVWNDLEQVTALEASYLAKDHVPEVFSLFDANATYNIHVFEDEAAQNLNNHFVIDGTEGMVNTTYVFNNKSDVNKYNVPDVYAKTESYLCKEYDGVSGVVPVKKTDDNGNEYYTYSGGAYSGDTSKQFIKDGQAVYGIDEENKMYTIVWMSGATPVHSQFDFHNTTVAFAVVWTPELRPDTVVLDFGLDVEIDVTKNDAMAPGLKGVRATAPAGVAMNYGTYNGNNFQNELAVKIGDLEIGTATVMDLNKVRFSLNKDNGMQFKEPVVFYYESEVNYRKEDVMVTENMYSSVTVIPATTVYYEDEFVQLTTWDAKTSDLLGDDDDIWEFEGTTISGTQAQDRPGVSKISLDLDADNNYGYDQAYESCSQYSLGSARKATVDAKKFVEAQFTFYGTGFDVISLTDNTSGTITVDVYNGTNVTYSSVNRVRSFAVDNYYGYTLQNDEWVLSTNTENALYQVPVMKVSGLNYGQYTVVITAAYAPLFDHNKTGSYNFTLDAIRIYDPTGNQSDVANKAYEADGEAYPEYYELRNKIIEAKTFNSANSNDVNGIVFIDSADQTASIKDYISFGPNNEVYLAGPQNDEQRGQAIAFALKAPDDKEGYDPDKIHIGLKSVGGTAKVKISYVNGNEVVTAFEQELATATDMYYDITALDDETVVIESVGDAILSITNVKFTYKTEVAAASGSSSSGSSSSSSESAVAEEAISPFTIRMEDIEVILAYLNKSVEEEIIPEAPEVTEPETEAPTETEVTEPEATEPETEPTKPSKPTKVDTAELKAAVEAAKKLKEKDYTKESFKALDKAIKSAEKILKDRKATQEKIDEALVELNEAVEALEANTPATKPGKDEKPNQNKPGKEEKPEKDTKPDKDEKPADNKPGKPENNNQNKPANNKGPAAAVAHAQKVADTVGAIAEALFGWMFR